MSEYHKIQTVFNRDPATKFKTLIEGEYACPEFEYLKDNLWVFTEKVDGTNIRVMYKGIWRGKGESPIEFAGRTDRAEIPKHLITVLHEMFDYKGDLFISIFGDSRVTLYGEGYGPKIQKGGGNYRDDCSFVLFDIKIGDWWLKRIDVIKIANELNIDTVPGGGVGTLSQMVAIVKAGFKSQWGDFQAEGIVARPMTELMGRDGKRIITKIKTKDFIRG